MKKILAILTALMLCLTCVNVSATEATLDEPESKYDYVFGEVSGYQIVYKAPESWLDSDNCITLGNFYFYTKSESLPFYNMEALESADMYGVYPGAEVPFLRIETSVNNERRLLVIKDQLANCLLPFLTQHYSRIDVIAPELLEGAVTEYIDPSDYEQTLMIFGIDSLDSSEVFNKLNSGKEN